MKRTSSVIITVSMVCFLTCFFSIPAESNEQAEVPASSRSKVSSQTQIDPVAPIKGPPSNASSKTPATVDRKSGQQFSSPTVGTRVSTGFCCKDGVLTVSNKSDCSKKRGVFYADERSAIGGCKGFCCKDGKLQETTKDICIKKFRGKFYSNRKTAENSCKGWCCSNFDVAAKTERQCGAVKGKFFGTKAEADRFCSSRKGWCCVDGTIQRLAKIQCLKQKGTFAVSATKADRICRNVVKQAVPDHTSSQLSPQAKRVAAGAANIPRPLPDLEITRTWLDRNCVMQVDIMNGGGSISLQDFNKTRMHMSAGPKNELPKAKGYLKFADPHKKLLNPGGSVTFDTGIMVSGGTQSLAWVDTDHHIQESNEINNGDDQYLNCKKIPGSGPPSISARSRESGKSDASLKKREGRIAVQSPKPPQPRPGNGDEPGQANYIGAMLSGVTVIPNSNDNVDLAIVYISFSKNSQVLSTPRLGEKFDYRVVIRNVGGTGQTSNSPVAYFQMQLTDDPHLNYFAWIIESFSAPLPPLSAGQEHEIRGQMLVLPELQNNPVQPGMYKIDATINTSAYQMDDEPNQQNNHMTKSFEVLESYRPDLVTCLDDWNVKISKKSSIPIYVKNVGPGASWPTTFTFYLEKHGHHNFPVPALASGQTYKIPFPKTFFWVQGTLDMIGNVDPGDTLLELDNGNNKRCATLKKWTANPYNYEAFPSCSDVHPCSTVTPVTGGN